MEEKVALNFKKIIFNFLFKNKNFPFDIKASLIETFDRLEQDFTCTNISGIQDCSLIVSFIFSYLPNYYFQVYTMINFYHALIVNILNNLIFYYYFLILLF